VSGSDLLLAFRAGGERFAIPLERVREAARPRRITPLPGAPSSWSGVALVRGEALGVVDVAAAVGLPSSASRPSPLVIVLRDCDHAILVDSIDGVEPYPAGRSSPPPPGRGALSGVVAEEGGFLSLLDVDRLGAGSEP
jgi:purine-binding chemotaxis protein CheW